MRNCTGLLALLLVLGLVLGSGRLVTAAHEIQNGAKAPILVMNPMAPHMTMSGTCEKCLGKDPATHACFVVCFGVEAILPDTNIVRVLARAPLSPLADRQLNGSAVPPDPPPPKLSVLA